MPGQHTPDHTKRQRHPIREAPDTRDLGARNEETWRGPGEEPRNVQKAGGGVKGKSMGGAFVGRYARGQGKVHSNREPKPRGHDKIGEEEP